MIDFTPQIIEKFYSFIEPIPFHECWEFVGAAGPGGYGQFSNSLTTRVAHRIMWILKFGKIPKGMVICHKCDNKTCVRPEHLFIGTQLDNIRDMISKGRDRGLSKLCRDKTHCKHGHEFTIENTTRRKNNWRRCKTCDKALDKKRYYAGQRR